MGFWVERSQRVVPFSSVDVDLDHLAKVGLLGFSPMKFALRICLFSVLSSIPVTPQFLVTLTTWNFKGTLIRL